MKIDKVYINAVFMTLGMVNLLFIVNGISKYYGIGGLFWVIGVPSGFYLAGYRIKSPFVKKDEKV